MTITGITHVQHHTLIKVYFFLVVVFIKHRDWRNKIQLQPWSIVQQCYYMYSCCKEDQILLKLINCIYEAINFKHLYSKMLMFELVKEIYAKKKSNLKGANTHE